jgi:hypothetical protein
MEELLGSFRAFLESLCLQMKIYEELPGILDKEEECVGGFALGEFEKIFTIKDQLVKRAQAAEERRLNLLKRICFLISYDARGKLPSLKTFLIIFGNYVNNVKELVGSDCAEQLKQLLSEFHQVADQYIALFDIVGPRIYRNQQVLRKLSNNFGRSVVLLESQLNMPNNYDAQGKRKSQLKSAGLTSSLQVKA